MFRWLTRYIKRIDAYGIGIEFREPSAVPDLQTISAQRNAKPAVPQLTVSAPDSLPRPLSLARVIPEADLIAAIERAIAAIPAGCRLGGLTIGKPGRPRALIYVGSCPDNCDRSLRVLAKPYGYNVSPVRDLTLGGIRTASLDDPMGY